MVSWYVCRCQPRLFVESELLWNPAGVLVLVPASIRSEMPDLGSIQRKRGSPKMKNKP